MSEPMPENIKFELKLSSDQTLTPEQLQAQQDFYDQWTAPTTEPVDFEAEREAYLARRQITGEKGPWTEWAETLPDDTTLI